MKAISCNAAYGSGGLGQHFAQIVEEARADGSLARYYAPGIRPGDEAVGTQVREEMSQWLARCTPVRFSPGWQNHLGSDLFDRAVALQLAGEIDTFTGFGGQSLRCFARARKLGVSRLELVSATSHVDNVACQHAKALSLHRLEASWLHAAQRRKTRREYAAADRIWVTSEYARRSFLDAGVPPAKLKRAALQPHPRFVPAVSRPDDDTFRIVYTGSLTVVKGLPLLRQAFEKLRIPRMELTLVGGWASRGMRRYFEAWQGRDGRLRILPGDPLPHLQRADVYVHPSWDDGWAYAPMEALACGVPVIVTKNTGMAETVREGVNGYVVPTGEWEALLARLEQLHRAPLRSTATLVQTAKAGTEEGEPDVRGSA